LVRILELDNDSNLRDHIHNLRIKGFCEIISNPNKGYWWSEEVSEIIKCKNDLEKRAAKQFKVVRAYKKRLVDKSDPYDLFKQAKELKLI